MPLDIATGSTCFVDANILYYCIVDTPSVSEPSRTFIARVERSEIVAHTTMHVLADVVHKTMMAEIALRFRKSRSGLIGWLKKHPEALAHLPVTNEAAARLRRLPLRLLSVEPTLLPDVVRLAEAHQLLTNDAIIAATMKQCGLVHLVTNDDGFDRVPDLTIWKPR